MKAAVIGAVVAATLTGLVLSFAAAAASSPPPGPTTPYPPVASNPDKCKVERIQVAQAQLNYDSALENYRRILELYSRGAASASEVRSARESLDRAALALTNARYAEATCQNNAKPNPDNCVNLNLELNRLLDELAITKDLEAIAKENYESAKRAYDQGALSAEEMRRAQLAYEQAKLQTQLIEAKIEEARKRLQDARCEVKERPLPTPTPSGTNTPAPSPSTGPSTSPSGPTTSPSSPPTSPSTSPSSPTTSPSGPPSTTVSPSSTVVPAYS